MSICTLYLQEGYFVNGLDKKREASRKNRYVKKQEKPCGYGISKNKKTIQNFFGGVGFEACMGVYRGVLIERRKGTHAKKRATLGTLRSNDKFGRDQKTERGEKNLETAS